MLPVRSNILPYSQCLYTCFLYHYDGPFHLPKIRTISDHQLDKQMYWECRGSILPCACCIPIDIVKIKTKYLHYTRVCLWLSCRSATCILSKLGMRMQRSMDIHKELFHLKSSGCSCLRTTVSHFVCIDVLKNGPNNMDRKISPLISLIIFFSDHPPMLKYKGARQSTLNLLCEIALEKSGTKCKLFVHPVSRFLCVVLQMLDFLIISQN